MRAVGTLRCDPLPRGGWGDLVVPWAGMIFCCQGLYMPTAPPRARGAVRWGSVPPPGATRMLAFSSPPPSHSESNPRGASEGANTARLGSCRWLWHRLPRILVVPGGRSLGGRVGGAAAHGMGRGGGRLGGLAAIPFASPYGTPMSFSQIPLVIRLVFSKAKPGCQMVGHPRLCAAIVLCTPKISTRE
jgi:hypothetical protein